eukprot:COSAG02_NODE_4038_length_5874_cov_2.627661_3_plen_105_part_00
MFAASTGGRKPVNWRLLCEVLGALRRTHGYSCWVMMTRSQRTTLFLASPLLLTATTGESRGGGGGGDCTKLQPAGCTLTDRFRRGVRSSDRPVHARWIEWSGED